MKIALTVKGAGLGAWLDDDFANCMQVMIVDDNNRFESWLNPYKNGNETSPILLSDAIIKEKVDALITNKISEPVITHLQNAGIKLIIKDGGTVFDLVDEARNTLQLQS